MAGDCFPAAVRTAGELIHLGHPQVLVVHGLPIGTGGDVEGRHHWHAWVETNVPDSSRGGKPTWAVADWSNGKQRLFIARTLYYRLGQTKQHLVWRFTPEQVAEHLETFGHAGPWHPTPDLVAGIVPA